jgi:hypothetical protein
MTDADRSSRPQTDGGQGCFAGTCFVVLVGEQPFYVSKTLARSRPIHEFQEAGPGATVRAIGFDHATSATRGRRRFPTQTPVGRKSDDSEEPELNP